MNDSKLTKITITPTAAALADSKAEPSASSSRDADAKPLDVMIAARDPDALFSGGGMRFPISFNLFN